jgi:hypothetical protein
MTKEKTTPGGERFFQTKGIINTVFMKSWQKNKYLSTG